MSIISLQIQDLKYLATKIHHVRVGVVQREHDAVRSVQLDHDDGIVEVIRRPERVLSLRHLGEASREDEAVPQVDRPGRLRALVTDGLLLDGASPRVQDPDLLVFARGEQLRAVPVPAGRVYQVGVAVDDDGGLASAHVPQDDQVVRSCGANVSRVQR